MEYTTRPPMPPTVAAAIVGVMADVPMLKKGEKNDHGNYKFASIDDFLEAVRPLCAKRGLIILQDEEVVETIAGVDKYGKPSNWLKMVFTFTLAHESGETWGWYPRRTIFVNAAMGSQAFGAGQSYALKQFLRATLLIATGEASNDGDSHAHSNLPNINPDFRDWKEFGLTKTKAAAESAALGRLIKSDEDTPDETMLDAHLADNANLIEAIQNCSNWWEPTNDGPGVGGQIEARRAILQSKTEVQI